MDNRTVKEATDAYLLTLSAFAEGHKTLKKMNSDLEPMEVIALTDAWWKGVMISAGIAGGKNDDSKGLF